MGWVGTEPSESVKVGLDLIMSVICFFVLRVFMLLYFIGCSEVSYVIVLFCCDFGFFLGGGRRYSNTPLPSLSAERGTEAAVSRMVPTTVCAFHRVFFPVAISDNVRASTSDTNGCPKAPCRGVSKRLASVALGGAWSPNPLLDLDARETKQLVYIIKLI